MLLVTCWSHDGHMLVSVHTGHMLVSVHAAGHVHTVCVVYRLLLC